KRFAHALFDVLATIECHYDAAPRHQIHQALKCGFHRVQVFIDVGMVEFHVRQQERCRHVMQKLRSLVEECGVVLIAFNDEVLALIDREAAGKVLGNAPDQKRWIQTSDLKDPCQHGSCGGLAVSSSNHNRLAGL